MLQNLDTVPDVVVIPAVKLFHCYVISVILLIMNLNVLNMCFLTVLDNPYERIV